MINERAFWQKLYQQSQQVDLQNIPVENIAFNHDLALPASVDTSQAKWLPSPAKGVKRLLLERKGGEKTSRATSIVAYAPDSHFTAHQHPKGEEFFVLAGTFSDEHGDYPAGTYVRNPPGSSHQPFSREGCLIWVKLQQFSASDSQHLVINVAEKAAELSDELLSRKVLFTGYENVEIVAAEQSFTLPVKWAELGMEILVLAGEVSDKSRHYHQGHWLRRPAKSRNSLLLAKNSRLLIKYGHLG